MITQRTKAEGGRMKAEVAPIIEQLQTVAESDDWRAELLEVGYSIIDLAVERDKPVYGIVLTRPAHERDSAEAQQLGQVVLQGADYPTTWSHARELAGVMIAAPYQVRRYTYRIVPFDEMQADVAQYKLDLDTTRRELEAVPVANWPVREQLGVQ